MDQELVNLFLQSAGSPSGASRTTNLLDDILLAYIAGGMNPQTLVNNNVGGGSSRLMQNYMSDPNPAMQQVIQHIQQGTDPYRLSSFVDSVVSNNSDAVTQLGFQPSDFKNLALAMNREFTGTDSSGGSSSRGGSGQAGFDFAKAGLSNPLDVYDVTNAPLNDEAINFISEQRKLGTAADKDFSSSSQKASLAKTALEDAPGVFARSYDKDRLASLALQERGKARPSGRGAIATTELINWIKEQEGEVTQKELNKKIEEFRPPSYAAVDTESYNRFSSGLKKKVPKSVVSSTDVDVNSKQFQEFRRQIDASRRAAYKSQEAGRQEMATRKGAVQAANAAGRTPLGDELKSRLGLLAKLKK